MTLFEMLIRSQMTYHFTAPSLYARQDKLQIVGKCLVFGRKKPYTLYACEGPRGGMVEVKISYSAYRKSYRVQYSCP